MKITIPKNTPIILSDSAEPLVYIALLSQSGTNAPTSNILDNTLGDITFERVYRGIYNLISNGLFALNKTRVLIGGVYNNDSNGVGCFIGVRGYGLSENVMTIDTTYLDGTNSDDLLLNTSIEILVYP